MFDDADVIYSYSRQQAIEDGVLVDVTETARECGFKYPVAVTARVWAEVIVPPEKARSVGQSEAGRLWDVLWMLLVAIKRSPAGQDTLFYDVIVSDGRKRETVKLKAVCGPGDEGEPVVTLMLPTEDRSSGANLSAVDRSGGGRFVGTPCGRRGRGGGGTARRSSRP